MCNKRLLTYLLRPSQPTGAASLPVDCCRLRRLAIKWRCDTLCFNLRRQNITQPEVHGPIFGCATRPSVRPSVRPQCLYRQLTPVQRGAISLHTVEGFQ